MQADIEHVLIDRQRISQRLDALAAQIVADLQRSSGAEHPPEITLVPILTGSIVFVADLIRRLPHRMRIHLIAASSYPGTATTSQGVTIDERLCSVPDSLAGRHVLLLDDILDSGHTLNRVTDELTRRGPASIRSCVLLRKQRPQAIACPVDYVAFEIPDAFIVGYGLDYDGYYRNLPDIVTLKPSILPPPPPEVPPAPPEGFTAPPDVAAVPPEVFTARPKNSSATPQVSPARAEAAPKPTDASPTRCAGSPSS